MSSEAMKEGTSVGVRETEVPVTEANTAITTTDSVVTTAIPVSSQPNPSITTPAVPFVTQSSSPFSTPAQFQIGFGGLGFTPPQTPFPSLQMTPPSIPPIPQNPYITTNSPIQMSTQNHPWTQYTQNTPGGTTDDIHFAQALQLNQIPTYPPAPSLSSATPPTGISGNMPVQIPTPAQPTPMAIPPHPHMFPGAVPSMSPYMPYGGMATMNPMGANPYQFPLYGMSHHQLPWGFPQTTASKFAPELLQYESPNLSKLPHVPRYDGTTDPDDHIDTYEWMMASLKIDERFQCTYFPVTLTGNAGTWFKTLPQGCIRNFAQLKYLFLSNFMQLRRYKGDTNTILGCRQREGESIREYYQRFTKATLDVPGHEEKIVVGAFTQGILPGELSLKLQAKVPTTRVELKEKVERYLRSTEGEEEKKKFLKASQHIHSKRSETTPLQITHRSQSRRDRFDRRYHPHSREDHYRHHKPHVTNRHQTNL